MSSRAPDGAERPRLLLVEDDAAVRRSLQLLLQSRGFDVRAYRSGAGLADDQEALRAVCLVADLMLPDGNALALLDELKVVGWEGASILISGHLEPGVEASALAKGFDRVLAKPVPDSLLTGCISQLLSKRRASADARTPRG